MERTIKVTGNGKLSVAPDLVVIKMELRETLPEYSIAVKKSAEATESLKNLLEKFGVRRDEIKTLVFNINPMFEAHKEWNSYKQKLVGYEYIHSLKVSLDADSELLGKCLYALSCSLLDPKFTVEYTVKDPEECKSRLIAAAVENSRVKANAIASSAGITLGPIVSVDYSWSEMAIVARPMGNFPSLKTRSNVNEEILPVPLNPDDIDITDTVTIVWAID